MRMLVVLIAALLLTACAGAPVQSTKAPLPRNVYEIDYDRIGAVERHARRHDGEVVLVSLPTRRVSVPAPEKD